MRRCKAVWGRQRADCVTELGCSPRPSVTHRQPCHCQQDQQGRGICPPPSYPYLCLCPELFLVRIPPLILVSFWTCCNKVTAYIKLCISKQLLLPISLQRQRLGSEQLIQRMFISQTEDSRKKIAAMFVFSDLIRHLATTACVLSKRATTRVKVQANLRSPTTISSSLRMVSSMQNLVFCGLI